MPFSVRSKCNEIRPAAEFYKQRTSVDGLTAYCKECSLMSTRRWRAAMKEGGKESLHLFQPNQG